MSKTQKAVLVLVAGAGVAAVGKGVAAGAARDLQLTPLEFGLVFVIVATSVAAIARTI